MNYVVTEVTDDSFTIWDGKTTHPDYIKPTPMGEMTFLNQPNHGFQVKDIVQLTVRLIKSANPTDAQLVEELLEKGVGKRLAHQEGSSV